MVDLPLAQDGPAIAKTNALPLLSTCTVTSGTFVPSVTPSGPNHPMAPLQRVYSSSDLMVTYFSAKTDGTST